jgi:hypothetical protein
MAEKAIMPLPQDLLEQAKFLVRREQRKPKQASLRRAVSAAYYAAFHLLGADAASQASPPSPAGLRIRVQRSLEHGAMKEAAKRFESQRLPDTIKPLVPIPLPSDLVALAQCFIRLQEERHAADYDLTSPFDRVRAQDAVDLASRLFTYWEKVKATEAARLFLAALVFPKLGSR